MAQRDRQNGQQQPLGPGALVKKASQQSWRNGYAAGSRFAAAWRCRLYFLTLTKGIFMSQTKMESKAGMQPRHGQVFKPESRGQLCVDGVNAQCPLQSWHVNGLESGKFFPAAVAGLMDPLAPTDTPNAAPPADGKIASAGQAHSAVLDEQSAERWAKHPAKSGQEMEFQWSYHARHLTRRWNYFITKADWNPNQPLSRAQFESEPFYKVEMSAQPYWEHSAELMPPEPTIHMMRMPQRQGYHVVLAVWEVADTGNAFYQVIDFDFS